MVVPFGGWSASEPLEIVADALRLEVEGQVGLVVRAAWRGFRNDVASDASGGSGDEDREL
jgi:hypothetical protein